MRNHWETEIKVGAFLTIGIILIMISIMTLSSNHSFFSTKNEYFARFTSVDGLISGAKVVLGGVHVGSVQQIDFDTTHRDIKVTISVSKKALDWIRKDSQVEIATQGVLGDKYISINPGSPEQPLLPPNSEIGNRPSKDLSVFLNKGDQLILSLNDVAVHLKNLLVSFERDNRNEVFFKGMANAAKNLASLTEKLNQKVDHSKMETTFSNVREITEKINNGTGTLGALVNDSSLYDDLRSLMGGVSRNRVVRNLVRQTVKSSHEKQSKTDESNPPTQ